MKNILITAGVHGDEFGSIFIARELKGWVEGKDIRNVDVLPNVNLRAIESWQRENPEDGKDLNRVFPGDKNGSITEKTAFDLFEKASEYDCVIDLHTYGENSRCLPYMLTDLDKEYNVDLCKNVGIDYAVQTGGDSGQLFIELSNNDIPSMIIESGGSHYLREGIMNDVLDTLKGFISDESRWKKVRFYDKYERLNPKIEGVFEPIKKPGDLVKEGEIIGFLDEEPITFGKNGFVLGIKMKGKYDHEEESLIAIAYNESKKSEDF